jgi:recombination protein RecA
LRRRASLFREAEAGVDQLAPGLLDSGIRRVEHVVAGFGIATLDLILGGGLRGLSEIYGEESTGKTALIAHLLATAQEAGRAVALCSSEMFDGDYFSRLGVDLSNLVLMEARLDSLTDLIIDFVAEMGDCVIAVDSLTATRPSNDNNLTRWNEEAYYFLDTLSDDLPASAVVAVSSQVRVKRSLTPGQRGRGTESATRWASDLFQTRIEVTRGEVTEDSYQMVVNVVANTAAKPAKWVQLPAVKGWGVNRGLDLVRCATSMGALKQKGAHYYLGFRHIGHGEAEAAETLASNRECLETVLRNMRTVVDG